MLRLWENQPAGFKHGPANLRRKLGAEDGLLRAGRDAIVPRRGGRQRSERCRGGTAAAAHLLLQPPLRYPAGRQVPDRGRQASLKLRLRRTHQRRWAGGVLPAGAMR